MALALLTGAAAWRRAVRVHDAQAWIGERARLTPGPRARDRYIGAAACHSCHPDAWASWHRTHHRTMTQLADTATIAARWDGVVLPDGTRLRSDGARPLVERVADDGTVHVDPVVMTTGAHHMQIYWTPSPGGDTLHALAYAWLMDDRRFVPNEATLLRPPDDAATYTWNRVCIRCHAVAGSPGWRAGTSAIDTRVAELGIACEACHGPGREHAEAHRAPWARTPHEDGDPTIVNPARLEPDAASEICAQCHAITLEHDEARWLAHGPSHAPPDRLAQWGTLVRHPSRADLPQLDAVLEQDADYLVDRFWPDGMVRVTGREHGAMIESACHRGGALSCLSCHSMHASDPDDQLRAGAEGDGACTQCHARDRYAARAHSHHDAVACADCHMPHTSWGLLGAIRSHQIDSPDPDVADATGRPLACNLCHLDRSRAWSRHWWRAWWRQPPTDAIDDEAAAPDTEPSAAYAWLVAGDAGQRALAAWHLAWPPARAAADETDWQAALLLEALDDPYPAVRLVAWRSLVRLHPELAGDLGDGVLPDTGDAERIRAVLDEPTKRTRAIAIDREVIAKLRDARDDRRVALAE